MLMHVTIDDILDIPTSEDQDYTPNHMVMYAVLNYAVLTFLY